MKSLGLLLLLGLLAGAYAEGDGDTDGAEEPCFLKAMGEITDLSTIYEILASTQVLPPNTGDVSTLLLPNGAAFADFVINVAQALDLAAKVDEDPFFKAQIDSVLMGHVLLGRNIPLANLTAGFPTALSLINNNTAFDVIVSEDLSTVTSGGGTVANIIGEPIMLCDTTAYQIDKVLLPGTWLELPNTTHDEIFGLIANLTAIDVQ